MKYVILIALLVLSSKTAHAEWVKIGESAAQDMTAYYDPDTIREIGKLRKIWVLFDHATPQTAGGFSYLSILQQHEYDCTEERVRILAQMAYAGKMQSGKTMPLDSNEDPWSPVPPGTFYQTFWTYVCAKQ